MNENNILLIDEDWQPIFTMDDYEALKDILKKFLKTYTGNMDIPVEDWLRQSLKEELPEKSDEYIEDSVSNIMSEIRVSEKKLDSMSQGISDGMDKSEWFVSDIQRAASVMSTRPTEEYIRQLDTALDMANDALYKTIITKGGAINQNPN